MGQMADHTDFQGHHLVDGKLAPNRQAGGLSNRVKHR